MSIALDSVLTAPRSNSSMDRCFYPPQAVWVPMALVPCLQTQFNQRATTETPPMTAVAPVQTTSVPNPLP